MQYNNFLKKDGSKTGFLIAGKGAHNSVIFTPTIYKVKPRYVHSNAPTFSLVDGYGKHISSLFPSGIENIYLGDFQNRGLIAMERGENSLEIFLSEIPPAYLKSKLIAGELNAELLQSRKAA